MRERRDRNDLGDRRDWRDWILRQLAKRWFLPLVLIPGPVLFLLVMGLRLHSEFAHDEATCPYILSVERSFGLSQVREEKRSCQTGVEEHRWVLIPDGGGDPIELGRLRLSSDHFAGANYGWTGEAGASGCVRVDIRAGVEANGTGFTNCTR